MPTLSGAALLFDGTVLGGGNPFATFTLNSHESATTRSNLGTHVNAELIACNASADESALVAGPSHVCTAAEAAGCNDCICRGNGAGTRVCKANMFDESVQLLSKFGGSGWAPQSAFPSFIQLTFPAVPAGVSSITLRFTMDSRYRPQLYGGNPCPKASETYNCSLCVAGPWDYSMPAGLHLLWSAAGRTDYVITGPLTDLAQAWSRAHETGDANQRTIVIESPPELVLAPGDYPVVAFLAFNQCVGYAEVERDESGKCNPSWGAPDAYPLANRNTAFFLERATLLYRQELSVLKSATHGGAPARLLRLLRARLTNLALLCVEASLKEDSE